MVGPLPGRLKLVQKVGGALCMGGGLKDRALVIAQDCQSILDVGRVLFARLWRELKACAQEGSAQFRDQLFGRVAFVAKQTRGNYEQIESAVNEMMTVLVSTQSIAAKGIVNYRAWLMKVAHGNVISAFDFAQNLATAKSVPDVIEYSRAHARIQFDALAAQTKELAELTHNVATEMAEPINAGIAGTGENAA